MRKSNPYENKKGQEMIDFVNSKYPKFKEIFGFSPCKTAEYTSRSQEEHEHINFASVLERYEFLYNEVTEDPSAERIAKYLKAFTAAMETESDYVDEETGWQTNVDAEYINEECEIGDLEICKTCADIAIDEMSCNYECC